MKKASSVDKKISVPRKKRASSKDEGVGKSRFNLYKNALGHFTKSVKMGFYLEAITIMESLISDRLESRISFVIEDDFSFRPLGPLISKLISIENDGEMKLIINEIDKWREERNHALHETAKIAQYQVKDWNRQIESLKPIADNGLLLFRKIDRKCSQLKKQEMKLNKK